MSYSELPFSGFATGVITEVVEVSEHSALVVIDDMALTLIFISHTPFAGDYVIENELIEHEQY